MIEYWMKSTDGSQRRGGLSVRCGVIVDASITGTPRRPRGLKEYEGVTDREEEGGMEVSEEAMFKEHHQA